MGTSLKTVEYAFPPLASMVDNTLTALTTITVYLPEASKVFKSVIIKVSAMSTATATGNVTSRRVRTQLTSAPVADITTNSNLYTGSGEDIFVFHAADLTSHFNTYWSGTSQTLDCSVQYDGTATGIAWTNVCATVYITYEYDDTSATQIKTVRIPLNENVGNGVTTKPGTALATIPALDTELPEAGKVYRSSFVVFQGNINRAAATDCTVTFQLDSLTAHTTGVFEGVSNTDFWVRYIWDISAQLDTANTMGYYRYGSLASCWNHMQSWLVVTYEFTLSGTTALFNSVMLPIAIASPMGSSTVVYQRTERELFIEEPATITTKQIAFYPHWDQSASMGSSMQMRVGTGSFVAYTDRAATLAGSNGAMCRNDSAFTLARGRNELSFDIISTSSTQLGFNVSGFWLVNYTSGVPTAGPCAANHTVLWNLGAKFDGAAGVSRTVSAIAPALPETYRFYSAVGLRYEYVSNSTGSAAGVTVLVERLASTEGGLKWESAYTDIGLTSPETGLRHCFAQIRTLFNRWANDPYLVANGHGDRLDLQTARRWRAVIGNNCSSFDYLDLMLTYHNITFSIAGNITGSSGGTVNITAHRTATGEIIAETSRVGDGAYSVPWYDNTENVYVVAKESGTLLGRSDDALAT